MQKYSVLHTPIGKYKPHKQEFLDVVGRTIAYREDKFPKEPKTVASKSANAKKESESVAAADAATTTTTTTEDVPASISTTDTEVAVQKDDSPYSSDEEEDSAPEYEEAVEPKENIFDFDYNMKPKDTEQLSEKDRRAIAFYDRVLKYISDSHQGYKVQYYYYDGGSQKAKSLKHPLIILKKRKENSRTIDAYYFTISVRANKSSEFAKFYDYLVPAVAWHNLKEVKGSLQDLHLEPYITNPFGGVTPDVLKAMINKNRSYFKPRDGLNPDLWMKTENPLRPQ